MQAVCGPVCGLPVQGSPVLSSFLHQEGRCGCITTQFLGLSLPTKVGCSYSQCLCQCPVWHLSFVLLQYSLVGFIGECFRLPRTLYGFLFCCMLFFKSCMLCPHARIIFVWFILPSLNTLEVVTSLCTQQRFPSGKRWLAGLAIQFLFLFPSFYLPIH